MSTAVLATEKVDEHLNTQLDAFLGALTELSRQYKIGIAGDPVLFCLEDEDLDRVYSSDANSALAY